jgi:RNA polymerase sigma factor (sigma-70 family)
MNRSRLNHNTVEELISVYQKQGHPEILEEIIDRNRKLLYKIANMYKNSQHNKDDILQMAYTGLLVAINRFKKGNNKFSTFAFYCIKGEILHNLRDTNLIKIPRWLQKLNTIFNKFVLDFKSKNGRYPTKDEISSGINVSIESMDEILKAREITIYNKDSKDQFNHSEEIIDRSLIKSKSPKSFELVMEDKILIWDAVDRLKGLNKKILVLKYIFGFSQEEIGKKMGISQKTVSRNIKDSLEKIKEDIA